MSFVTASSPGKAVLSGEYAVLDGAPAICMAVSHRAEATIEDHGGPFNRVVAPGFCTEEGRFVVKAGQLEWLAGGEAYALFAAVWRKVNPVLDGFVSCSLDTRSFVDVASGSKLGTGSSAALSAALAAAMCAALAPGVDARQVAQVAHREFQGGAGSGADVACSLSGGLIEYRMNANRPLQLDWPEGLVSALVWSGVAAGTQDKLNRLGRTSRKQSRADLSTAAEEVAAAWRSNDRQQVLDAYDPYTRLLRKFSVDHGLGIFDAGHDALADTANKMGLVYKPCGAGGGDIGIALAQDEAAIAELLASPAAAGFVRLDASIDIEGTQCTRERN